MCTWRTQRIRCTETGIEFEGLQTSDPDPGYNCVAWALGRNDRFWWPDMWGATAEGARDEFWPLPYVGHYAMAQIENLLAHYGYEKTEIFDYETGVAKIAVYAEGDTPTHLARMIMPDEFPDVPAGLWTSKIFRGIDAAHELNALATPQIFGSVFAVYAKTIPTTAPARPRSAA